MNILILILLYSLITVFSLGGNVVSADNQDSISFYQNAVNAGDEYVDEFALASKNGKFGFVNKENKFVVKPEYEAAQNAPGDYFFVCKDKNGHKCAYMNKKTKKLLTEFKYLGCGNGDISEGFYDGMAKVVIVDENGDWKTGYIDEKGEEVIPARYYYGSPFKNGIAEVQLHKDKPTELVKIDKKGNIIPIN